LGEPKRKIVLVAMIVLSLCFFHLWQDFCCV